MSGSPWSSTRNGTRRSAILRKDNRLRAAGATDVAASASALQQMCHLVLTRFNAGLDARTPEGSTWLRRRMTLFRSLCLPSVRSQRARHPFRWLIICDDGHGSPDWFREQICQAVAGCAEIVWIQKTPATTLRSIVADLVSAGNAEVLVTTRLDNDDALARGFLDRVQQEVIESGDQFRFLNFPLGLQLSGTPDGAKFSARSLRKIVDPSNAFLSLAERTCGRPPLTVFAGKHSGVIDRYPTRQLRARPMWLQAIHGDNQRALSWGWPVHPGALADLDIDVHVTGMPTSLAVSRGKATAQLVARAVQSPKRVFRVARSRSR
jgi:hypothetical protein